MNNFILIFVVSIILLLILFVIVPLFLSDKPDGSENFLNEDGDHEYYDRSLIEKKNYFKKHPDKSRKEVRSIKNLIRELYNINRKTRNSR